MNKKALMIALIITSAFISSCKENTGTGIDNGGSNEIIPLKIGNQWVYQNIYYDSLGTVIFESPDTVTISRDTTIRGEKWYTLRGSIGYSFDVINRVNGYSYDGGATILQYKYPANLNDRYQTFIATPTDTMVVASLNAATSTIAGTFTCYQYNRFVPSRTSIRQISWVEPGKGIIKEEAYFANGALESRAQLVSRNLK